VPDDIAPTPHPLTLAQNPMLTASNPQRTLLPP
jgi:hypothetical protein